MFLAYVGIEAPFEVSTTLSMLSTFSILFRCWNVLRHYLCLKNDALYSSLRFRFRHVGAIPFSVRAQILWFVYFLSLLAWIDRHVEASRVTHIVNRWVIVNLDRGYIRADPILAEILDSHCLVRKNFLTVKVIAADALVPNRRTNAIYLRARVEHDPVEIVDSVAIRWLKVGFKFHCSRYCLLRRVHLPGFVLKVVRCIIYVLCPLKSLVHHCVEHA